MEEPRLVDPDDPFEDNVSNKRKPPKKWAGTTPLQKAALLATGRGPESKYPGFTDNTQRERFIALEEFALGMDDASRIEAAWIRHKIAETARLNENKVVLQVSLDELMRRIEAKHDPLARKKAMWKMDNAQRILQKKSVGEISEEAGVEVGLNEMEARRNNNKRT